MSPKPIAQHHHKPQSPYRCTLERGGDCTLRTGGANRSGAIFSAGQSQDPNGTVAADISLAVIHKRAKRPGTARRSELVNNCAAGENFAGERPAPARSQSQSPHPKRVIGRLLAEPEALAPTSIERRLLKAVISARWM